MRPFICDLYFTFFQSTRPFDSYDHCFSDYRKPFIVILCFSDYRKPFIVILCFSEYRKPFIVILCFSESEII